MLADRTRPNNTVTNRHALFIARLTPQRNKAQGKGMKRNTANSPAPLSGFVAGESVGSCLILL